MVRRIKISTGEAMHSSRKCMVAPTLEVDLLTKLSSLSHICKPDQFLETAKIDLL